MFMIFPDRDSKVWPNRIRSVHNDFCQHDETETPTTKCMFCAGLNSNMQILGHLHKTKKNIPTNIWEIISRLMHFKPIRFQHISTSTACWECWECLKLIFRYISSSNKTNSRSLHQTQCVTCDAKQNMQIIVDIIALASQ